MIKDDKKFIKITVSDTTPLYPPLWGGPKRIWNLYSNLGEGFDITYVGIDCGLDKKRVDRMLRDDFREIVQPVTSVYYPFRYFELKIIKNLTFDIFMYLCMIFDKGFTEELNKHEADILIATHPWSSPCFKIKKDQIFIYDSHNCEYVLMGEILKGRWYRSIVCFFVKLIEKAACKKSAIIIVSSEKDRELFVELYKIPEEKIFFIPNGACIEDMPSYEEKKRARARLKIEENKQILIFIGAYYNPNIEAAKFIVNEIAPKVKEVDIAILGTVSDYFRNNNVPANIKLIGRVSDSELFDWLLASDIGINPMFSGSGINMKMLDYFSFSLPVVTTWVGARGIDGVDSKDFIACKETEFADKIRRLLNDKNLRINIGMDARKLAEALYDWKKISGRLSVMLNDMVKFGEIISLKKPGACLKK